MVNTFSRFCTIHTIAYILVWVGAINWGLVGLGWYIDVDLNLVSLILGTWPAVEYAVYVIVWLSAIAMLFQKNCDYCAEDIVL